ncbi:MAG: 3-deoxy-8-phosphooctulonate synthase [Nitrospiraceae bacterium]|nr:MAG: 3-deoxy-8-phosphooctulonate synthase [Nitrospiraceae bacterium]
MILGDIHFGSNHPFLLIAGPCVIETEEKTLSVAEELKKISEETGTPIIFKSSYDKANRTSISSFRGPGIDKGLSILYKVKKQYKIPVLSDVHSTHEVEKASEVLDALQIPAFLCRQTDLIIAAAKTGKPVNIKKGQFLSPWDIENIIEKCISTGNKSVFITERGSCFGYNNLVVDFRSFPIMRSFGYPVIFDVTHSLQVPGGMGRSSGGQREFAEPLARAAVAVGVHGLFMEVHPDPDNAPCDGPNMLKLKDLPGLLMRLKKVEEAAETSYGKSH